MVLISPIICHATAQNANYKFRPHFSQFQNYNGPILGWLQSCAKKIDCKSFGKTIPDFVYSVICTLVSRVHMTFHILAKGYTQFLETRVHMTFYILTKGRVHNPWKPGYMTILTRSTVPSLYLESEIIYNSVIHKSQ